MKNLFNKLSEWSRRRRREMFASYFAVAPHTRILDLGSADGSNIARLLEGSDSLAGNVWCADVCETSLETAKQRFGFNTILLGDDSQLPFDTDFFDVVYCSSVIEHATGEKHDLEEILDHAAFVRRADVFQTRLAEEIRRVGKAYFVQTPNYYFPFETHSWLPCVQFLPRSVLLKVLRVCRRFWIKGTWPDWNLLDRKRMAELFPDSMIVGEKVMGMDKSIIAIKAV